MRILIVCLIIAIPVIAYFIITNLPVFGKLPANARLEKIKLLPNYKDGAIHNLSNTPMQPEGVSMLTIAKEYFFGKHPNTAPKKALSFVKPNLDKNESNQTEIIWFGHSSYLIKAPKTNILVDPIFSKSPSPFSFLGAKAYAGTDFIKAEDFKNIDIIVITHDHYDHLDYETILKLAPKTAKFVTSLGVGAHLEHWGIAKNKIIELAWTEEALVNNTFKFRALPARHFTGRLFKRNQTLWSSFILENINQGAQFKIYIGGDSGYDTHFKEIGSQYGPFDLAILECGQYNAYWPYIHMFPEQTVQASVDLNAKVLLPVHWAKFTLSMHPWNEPVIRACKEAEKQNVNITTPMLGESIIINKTYPNKHWWL